MASAWCVAAAHAAPQERLEAVLQLRHSTQLGTLQLERDVCMLTGTLGKVCRPASLHKMMTILSTATCVQVVERLEAVLQLQRFTQLGGLQLERDVCMLTGALGEVPQLLEEISCVLTLCVQVVERLEAVLQLQRFTQLGDLQLERDVRMLTGALSEVTQLLEGKDGGLL